MTPQPTIRPVSSIVAAVCITTAILGLVASAYCSVAQASLSSPHWQLKTDDTHLTLAVIDDRQVMIELRNPGNGWNWTPKSYKVPLLNRVLLATTDAYNVDWNRYPKWAYQDALVDTSDVHVMTPNGKLLARIDTKMACGNCCFGDDGSWLYICSDAFLVRVKTKVKGKGF